MEKFATMDKRVGWILTIALSVLVLANATVLAQNAEWMVFSTENTGLPDNVVTALSLDENGDLLVATASGALTKFNGSTWEVYIEPTDDIITHNVRVFYKDGSGIFWLGKTGLERFTKTQSVLYTNDSSGLPGDIVRSMLPTDDGKLWVGTSGGMVLFDKAINWSPVYTAENSPLPNNQIRDLIYDSQGDMWIATEGGVVKFDGTNWTVYSVTNSELSHNETRSLLFDHSGNLWVATSGGGLNMFDGTAWTVYDADSTDLPDNKVRDLALDNAGVLWMSTEGGLVSFDNGVFTVFNTLNSNLPTDALGNILIDGNGLLWIGTDIGLVKFDGTTFTHYTTRNTEMPNNDVNAITFDQTGTAWIATKDGLGLYNGSIWQVLNSSNTVFPDDDIRGVDMDSKGNMWIATYGGGLLKYDGSGWNLFTPLNPDDGIVSLLVDDDDNIWIAIEEGGVLKFDGTIAIPYNVANSDIPSDLILDLEPGSVWMASQDAGLIHFDGTTWSSYDYYNTDMPDNRLTTVLNAGENIWMGIYNFGLAQFSNGSEWTFYNKDNSEIPHNFINDLAVDSNGNLWLATGADWSVNSGGLAKFDGTTWTTLNMKNSPLPVNYLNVLSVDTQDNKWIGVAANGLAIYREGGIELKSNTAPVAASDQATVVQGAEVVIPVLSNDSDADGDALTVTGVGTFGTMGSVTINADNATITYQATASYVGSDSFTYTISDGNGGTATATVTVTVTGSSAVIDVSMPVKYALEQNYPNPFNPTTEIQYALPKTGHVVIKVFDLKGQEVATLMNGKVQAGYHQVQWNALAMPSGIYVYTIKSGDFFQQRKMMLVK